MFLNHFLVNYIEVICIQPADLPAENTLLMPDNHKDRCLTIGTICHCINPEHQCSFVIFMQFLPQRSPVHLFLCVEIIKLEFCFPRQLKRLIASN